MYLLLVSTTGLGLFAIGQVLKVASLTSELASSAAELASTKAAHKTALAKQKARAKLRQGLIAVPLLGAGLIIYFEEQDFQEWLHENPNGSRAEYLCEVAKYSTEIVDEIVRDTLNAAQYLPKSVQPNADTVRTWLEIPRCA